MTKYYAIIPAAGVGRRFGGIIPKQYMVINNQMLIDYSLSKLLRNERINKVIVALSEGDEHWTSSRFFNHPKLQTCLGGQQRADSVANGLQALQADDDDWVLVHDAARPCVSDADINKLMQQLSADKVGGLLAAPMVDTIKSVEEGVVSQTLQRDKLWRALTPQLFRFGLLRQALLQRCYDITDEASAIEALGLQPRVVEGDTHNIKITTATDLAFATWYLNSQEKKT